MEFDARILTGLFLSAPELPALRWGPCTMVAAMEIMGPAGKLRDANPGHRGYDPARPWLYPRLAHAAEFFGVTVQGDAHRALTDARTCAGILVEIQRRRTAPMDPAAQAEVLRLAVRAMREAQRRYFSDRSADALTAAKKAEATVDALLT